MCNAYYTSGKRLHSLSNSVKRGYVINMPFLKQQIHNMLEYAKTFFSCLSSGLRMYAVLVRDLRSDCYFLRLLEQKICTIYIYLCEVLSLFQMGGFSLFLPRDGCYAREQTTETCVCTAHDKATIQLNRSHRI